MSSWPTMVPFATMLWTKSVSAGGMSLLLGAASLFQKANWHLGDLLFIPLAPVDLVLVSELNSRMFWSSLKRVWLIKLLIVKMHAKLINAKNIPAGNCEFPIWRGKGRLPGLIDWANSAIVNHRRVNEWYTGSIMLTLTLCFDSRGEGYSQPPSRSITTKLDTELAIISRHFPERGLSTET